MNDSSWMFDASKALEQAQKTMRRGQKIGQNSYLTQHSYIQVSMLH
jgi:hypothetical protein